MTQPPPPFPPATDQGPPWAGIVARAINQLEDRVEARLALFHEELALLRQAGLDAPAPPTTRQRVALGAGKAVQVLGVATLLTAVASQLAAMFKPELAGPIDAFAAFLRGLAQ